MDVAVLLLFASFITVALSRPLLLNVAASCGVAALPGCLRGRALAGSATAATIAGAVGVCSPGSGSDSGGQTDSGGNGSVPGSVGTTAGSVGSALAIYSLLGCVISASSLFCGSRGSAIDPQEG